MTQAKVELHNLDEGISPSDVPVQRPLNTASDPQIQNTEFSCLPPVDTGKQAWQFLAACWVVEAVTFGFGFSFGVFQDFYSNHAPFAGSDSIAAIGTTAKSVMCIGTPFVVAVCRLYPRQARWFILFGLTIASLGLALSSFCTSVPHLIGVQGFVFGVCGCLAFCPCTLYIDEWFVRRKSLAYGIVWSALAFGGVIITLVIDVLLQNVGFKVTTRICAGILFGCSALLVYFIKPRMPYAAVTSRRPLNMRFVT